jgi:hypothetical protein
VLGRHDRDGPVTRSPSGDAGVRLDGAEANGRSGTRSSARTERAPGWWTSRRSQPARRRTIQHADPPLSSGLVELKRHVHTLPEKPDLIPYRTAYHASGPGASACRQREARWRCRTGPTRSASTPIWHDGQLHLRGVSSLPETTGRTVPADGAHLPPVAGQRQLLGAWRCSRCWGGPWPGGRTAPHLPAPVRAGHDRRRSPWLLPPTRSVVGARRPRPGRSPASATRAGRPTSSSRRGNDADRPRDGASGRRSPAAVPCKTIPFSPYGYDERQFCSPGFDMPVGLSAEQRLRDVSRISHVGRRPGLHPAGTSRPERSGWCMDAIEIVETDRRAGQPAAEGGAPAWQARALFKTRRIGAGCQRCRCSGCSILPTVRIRCSTWRSVRGCTTG